VTKKIITIVIDQEMEKKLRTLQCKMILEKNVSVSLSAVIEKMLHAELKAVEQLRDEKRRKIND